jgi:hypothetical protein
MIGNAVAGIYGVGGPPPSTTSYESIATASPVGVGSVSFSSIPSTFKHLQIRFSIIGTGSQRLGVQANGDTGGTNYAFHVLTGNGTSVFSDGSGNYSQLSIMYYGRTIALMPTVGIFDLMDYASTTKNKTSRSITGVEDNSVGTGYIELESSLWKSTAAVNSLTFLANSGTFTGSVALYGIKG